MDVVFYAGLDDTQLNAKLARARQGIAKTLGGVNGQFGGAAGLASLIPGIGQVGAAFTVAGGLVYAYNQRLEEAAESARVAGIEAVKAAREASTAFSASLTGGSVRAFGSDRTQKTAEALREVQEIRAAAEKKIAAELDAARKNKTDYDANIERRREEEKIQVIREKLLADVDAEIEAQARANVQRLRAAAFTAQQADAEASVVDEMSKHATELQKIDRMARDEPALAAEALSAERARHGARMDQIRAEEIGRQSALEQKADKENEARLAQEQRASLIDLELDKQAALIAGDTQRAESIQRLIEHQRRLAEIQALGVDEATRQMLLDKERANFAAGGGDRGGAPGTRSAGVGFINQGSLSLASLGGGSMERLQQQQVTQQQGTNQRLDQLITETKRKSGEARYA